MANKMYFALLSKGVEVSFRGYERVAYPVLGRKKGWWWDGLSCQFFNKEPITFPTARVRKELTIEEGAVYNELVGGVEILRFRLKTPLQVGKGKVTSLCFNAGAFGWGLTTD